MAPDLQLKFLAEAGTRAGGSTVSHLRWLNQWQPGHLGTMIVAVARCLLTKSRMRRIRAMGGVQLLSLLQSWSRQSTALLLASENRELKQGSWELEADAVLLMV